MELLTGPLINTSGMEHRIHNRTAVSLVQAHHAERTVPRVVIDVDTIHFIPLCDMNAFRSMSCSKGGSKTRLVANRFALCSVC